MRLFFTFISVDGKRGGKAARTVWGSLFREAAAGLGSRLEEAGARGGLVQRSGLLLWVGSWVLLGRRLQSGSCGLGLHCLDLSTNRYKWQGSRGQERGSFFIAQVWGMGEANFCRIIGMKGRQDTWQAWPSLPTDGSRVSSRVSEIHETLEAKWKGKIKKNLTRGTCGSTQTTQKCLFSPFYCYWGFPGSSNGKESAYYTGDPALVPGSGNPLKKGMATHSVFFPEESHRQRSLEGYTPWGHKGSDMTEQLTFWHFTSVSSEGCCNKMPHTGW